MSEENAQQGTVKVNDRRRFDEQGNPRGVDDDAPMPPPPEPAAAAEPASARPDETAALRAEHEALRLKFDELARAYQALNRDREEFKQRLQRERERMLDVERGNVATALLETLDELDLSLQAAEGDESPLAKGVRLIRDGVLAKLKAAGVERIELEGQPYDPNVAEAADMEIVTNPADDQKVTAVMRAGYKLRDRVIRPARVKVAKYVQPAQA